MLLRLTVVHERDGQSVDVEVAGDERDTFAGLVASGLTRCSPDTCPEGTWSADGREVLTRSLLGSPPLLDGAVLTHCCAPLPGQPEPAPPLLELHVIEGPDCGSVHPLPLGRHRVGRTGGTIRIRDLRLSRVHCEIHVAHDGVTVTDLGSTNGSALQDHGAVTAPTAWCPGQRLRVGRTTLLLRVPREPRAHLTPDGAGRVRYHRGPRRTGYAGTVALGMPSAPEAAARQRLPLAMMVLPLIVSGVLAVVLHSTTMLLFGLLGPVMLLSSWISDRRGGRASARRRRREHAEATARFGEQRDEALRVELRRRRASAADAAELAAQVRHRGTRLWERRPGDEDFLALRVGTGPVAASLTIIEATGPTATSTPPSESGTHPVLPDAPVTLDLRSGTVGLVGPREPVVRCAQHLLGQLAAWHSPADVALVVLSATRELAGDWAWSAWLPHLLRPSAAAGDDRFSALPALDLADGGAALRRQVELLRELHLREEPADPSGGPVRRQRRTVVVLDGAQRLRSVPGIPELLARGGRGGLHVVAIEDEAQGLPVETEVTVVLAGDGHPGRLEQRCADSPQQFTPDLVTDGWAEQVGRALAPLRDATPHDSRGQLPRQMRLLDVLGWDALSSKEIARRWVTSPRSTEAAVGVAMDGPYRLDLGRDGPHALLAGTTGAGKSELLQTLIASLALGNRPDQLCFVLIDYKGGSAFEACADLPHTVGLVTDLDEHLAGRALTSLGAELKRRERLLRQVGASDLEDYQRRCGSGDPPLPRLVLVIDEFRVLADEQPAFLDGLVRIAAVGRSLGVHLVLATQRPAGVVSADIKANVNLRIALRVRDRIDSEDVVESPDAAALPDDCPGRAVVRVAAEPLRTFQAARVGGGPPARVRHGLTVRRLGAERSPHGCPPAAEATGRPRAGAAVATDEPGGEPGGGSDLRRIVGAVVAATDELGVRAVASPWLAPLPAVLLLPEASPEASPEDRLSVPYAVADLPQMQCRQPVAWDLAAGGHLAVVGSPRSGRTTAVRTLAGSLAARLPSSEAHLFVLDGGDSLSVLGALPHCGAVVGREEVARGRRLVRRLAREVRDRRQRLAEQGYGSIEEQRGPHRGQPAGLEPPLPYLVLVVDGWEVFTQTYERVEHGAVVEELLQLVREGPAAGLRVLLTGDRCLLAPRVGASVSQKVCLRMTDETELLLAGVPRDAVPASMPPGRGIRLEDVVELQVCLLDTDPSAAAQNERIRNLARGGHRGTATSPGPAPLRVDPLPRRVSATELRAPGEGARVRPGIHLGLNGETLEPLLLDVPSTGLGLLVVGGPGTGKSTALATLAEELARAGRTVLHVTASGHDALGELLSTSPDADVLLDDVGRLLDGRAEQLLVEVLARQRHTGAVLCVAGDPGDLTSRYRGLVAELRRTRTGLILAPDSPAAGELVGTPSVPVDDERVPGRGLLALRGLITPVQVALPAGDVTLSP